MAAAPGEVGPSVAGLPACTAWEAPVRCEDCGACCREAFDSVPVGPEDEHTAARHPDLVVVHPDGWRDLRRVPAPGGTRCVALRGDGCAAAYRCAIYADRPAACADLEPGSPNCLFARRRVGLSGAPVSAPATR